MNIVFTPYGWEWRIQRGQLSGELLRPIHPLHHDVAYFAGWKVVVIVLWLPLAAFLALDLQADPQPHLAAGGGLLRSPSGALTSSAPCCCRCWA